MGFVFKALQKSLDRQVAVKVQFHACGDNEHFSESFASEAKAMARLNHPNLISVYDFGRIESMTYIVMEFVPAKSLYHSALGVKVDPEEAVRIIRKVCAGLAHAHANGVIHRDIKPANILMTTALEPKIGDFGLARHHGSRSGGVFMGTPGYVAPELFINPDAADCRSDIYAVGVILCQLLNGREPAAGGGESASLVDCPSSLVPICRRAINSDPNLRFQDISALDSALQSWQTKQEAKLAAAAPAKGMPLGRTPSPKSPQMLSASVTPQRLEGTGSGVSKGKGDHRYAIVRNLLLAGLLGSIPFTYMAVARWRDRNISQANASGEISRTYQPDNPLASPSNGQGQSGNEATTPDAKVPEKSLTGAAPPIPGDPLSPFDRANDSVASTSNQGRISQFDGLFRELRSNAGYGFHVDGGDVASGIQYGETKSTSLIVGKRIGNAIHADWIQAVSGSRHVFTYTLTPEGNLDMDGDWNDNGVQRHHHQILYRITDAATFQRDLTTAAGKASAAAVTAVKALSATLAKQGPQTRPLATRPGSIFGLNYGLFVKQTPENWVYGKDGTPAGAPGTGRMVDAFRLKGLPFPAEFRIYTATRGWMGWIPCDGNFATAGVRKLEAIQFSFPGGIPDGIQFYGRVCCGGVGWLRTVKIENLLVLGATDLDLNIEGIQLSCREGEQGNIDDWVKQADVRFNTFLTPGSSPSPTAVASLNQEPGLGRWYFDNNSRDSFKLLPDGVLMQNGRKGRWTCQNPGKSPRIYQLNWDNGKAIDTMTMSWDGTLMTGHGKDGNLHLIASRVDGSNQLRQGQRFASTDGGKMIPAGSTPQTASSQSNSSPTLKPAQPDLPISEAFAAAKADLDKMVTQMSVFRNEENAKFQMKIQELRRETAAKIKSNASALALDLSRSDPAKPWITADDLANRESSPLLVTKWRYTLKNEVTFCTDGTITGNPSSRWRRIYSHECFAAFGSGWADLICLDANGGQVVNKDGIRFKMTKTNAVVPALRVMPPAVWRLYDAEEDIKKATKEVIRKKAISVNQWAEAKSKGLAEVNQFLILARQSLQEDLEEIAKPAPSPEMLRRPAGQWEIKDGRMSFSQGGHLSLPSFSGEWFWVGDQAVAIVITKGHRTSVGICSVPGRDPVKLNIHTVMGENIGDALIVGHKSPVPSIITLGTH